MPTRQTLAKGPDDAAQYFADFVAFSRLELDSGGPDHHLWSIGEIAKQLAPNDPHERAWIIGCYMGPYNVPGGLAIWKRWPLDELWGAPIEDVETWLRDNWHGLPIRKERRPARSPKKMTEYLFSCAEWVRHDLFGGLETYDDLWRSLDVVKYVGRYAGMKMLEGMRRAGVTEAVQPDIRPRDAWSPRLALSYMYPEYDELLNRDKSRGSDEYAQTLAANLLLHTPFIPDIYHMEVLLCDFKQAVDGHYYPGRPLDSELEQVRQVKQHFGFSVEELALLGSARIGLFPSCFLGELQGWGGRRKELGATRWEHGYWWSDRVYDYAATTDLSNPVPR